MVEGQISDILNPCVIDNARFKNVGQSSKQSKLKCPQCGCKSLFRSGLRYYYDGSTSQRWLCRGCNHRFSVRPKNLDTLRDLEKRLNVLGQGNVGCQESNEFHSERAHNLLAEGHNLVNSKTRIYEAQREGTQQQTTTTPSTTNDNNSKIVNFLLALSRLNKSEGTIETWSSVLRKLANNTDMTPDSVKDYLRETKEWTNSSKAQAVTAYNAFLKHYGASWEKLKYVPDDKLHFIPTEAEIDSLIAGIGKVISAFLQFLKETGARCGEAANTQMERHRF